MTDFFDAAVIGAGHAGCEAALALARLNHSVLLACINKEYIASMPCNPSVGGPAKGVVVREIDALGGQMAINADKTALQIKMLNSSKGPGVRCFRQQSDKIEYRHLMRKTLEDNPNITIYEGIAEDIQLDNDYKVITFADGYTAKVKALVLTTGTYLSGKVMISDQVTISGPEGQKTSQKLGQSLRNLGLKTFRLKTGTPPRVLTESIDFSGLELQEGNIENEGFSFSTKETILLKDQIPCYLTYTNDKTHQIIKDNLYKSSVYSGVVEGKGPRYCPSIEDKIVRFSDKPRHQIFLEPESRSLNTTYVQGFSTSLPVNVQDEMIHTLPGLENCKVEKWAYAIEYDAIDARQLKSSLECIDQKGIFCAGQINGTSGYEEAAGQGLLAGINAARYLDNKEALILSRDNSYIGLMVDDLVTKGTNEPYRLFTSRSEYRLLLRHDNADQRLMPIGYEIGLLPQERHHNFRQKMSEVEELKAFLVNPVEYTPELLSYLKEKGYEESSLPHDYLSLLKRPNIELSDILPLNLKTYDKVVIKQAEIETKYAGYIEKENREAARLHKLEKLSLPLDWDYNKLSTLSLEARQKLSEVKPASIGQASRIPGLSAADIQVLAIELKNRKEDNNA